MTETRAEQRQKVLKAKVAMALYSEYGRVPHEVEIEQVYHLTRVLYKAVLGTHYLRKQQEKSGQLVLHKILGMVTTSNSELLRQDTERTGIPQSIFDHL